MSRSRHLFNAALLAGAPWLALAPAIGGVVIGSGGNTPFGGSSSYVAVGELSGASGDKRWDYAGTATTSRRETLPGNSGFVTLDHVVATDTGALSLSAAASATLAFAGGTLKLRGWSESILNDYVQVLTHGTPFSGGFISVKWRVDGTLAASYRVPAGYPGDLGAAYGWEGTHIAHAATYFSVIDPVSRDLVTSVQSNLGHMRLISGHSSAPSDNKLLATEYMEDIDLFSANSVNGPFRGKRSWESRDDIDKEVGREDQVPIAAGVVDVQFALGSYYNGYWHQIDFGGLEIGLDALFDHTATIGEVHLFNPDGTPYVGQWELVSGKGYDYPEFIVGGPAAGVPLPATALLVVLGLGAGALRPSRRRAAGAGHAAAA